jgi:mannose/cellobiose epimerase-like protein (N-acyl-D-glucosamine 2-epimerase family)
MSRMAADGTRKWVTLTPHRAWLLRQAEALFSFFEAHAIDPGGGFFDLDDSGLPLQKPANRQLHATTRMVHSFAIAHLMGRPGADAIVDHGMAYLWNGHRDPANGGYFYGVGDAGPTDDTKQAYGHAFVLLAAASAKVAGHPDADRLLADISTVLTERFWEDRHGASAEQFTSDWHAYDRYRGQNSNMHLTEALMAAFEATGDSIYLRMAERIADLVILRHAGQNEWRVPEHFDADWNLDRAYDGNPMFRPAGTLPGHALEWSRLLVQLWELGGRTKPGLPEAAKNLFRRAVTDGWDGEAGGFHYTLDEAGAPRLRNRYWWPCSEGIGGAAVLNAVDGDPVYETWYRRIWGFVAAHMIDREHGGWYPELDDRLRPAGGIFVGKPDIYHALQACLVPLLPTTGSITRGLAGTGVRLELD